MFDSIDGGLLQTEVESFNYNGESVVFPLRMNIGQILT
jgi:hypothetical protein